MHVSDPDWWYERYLSKAFGEGLPAVRRHVLGVLGAQLYRTALARDSNFAMLLEEFKNVRVAVAGTDHEAYFAISAALIGVQANSAYRSLAIHVRRFAGSAHPHAVTLFERCLPQARYERLRAAKQGIALSRSPCPPEAILAIYTRYELLLGRTSGASDPLEMNRHAGIPSI